MKNLVSFRLIPKITVVLLTAAITWVAIISSGIVVLTFAHEEECTPTLDTLPDCVTHHWVDGQIYNKAIYNKLLSLANDAVDARDNGDIEGALELLEVFVETVETNIPKKISEEAAGHMIYHAREAMAALEEYA